MSLPLLFPADAGEPMSDVVVASAKVERYAFSDITRQVSLRNTGTNTLWFSFNRRKWIDIAAGTSWDDRVSIREFWHCTQVGRTRFAVIGVALMGAASEEEEEDDDVVDDEGEA